VHTPSLNTLRHGLLPALILSSLLLQYAAVQHVLVHMGLGVPRVSAGAPLSGEDTNPAGQTGGCEAPQLHAVIDGTPFPEGPGVTPDAPRLEAFLDFQVAVAERMPPTAHSRGPPLHSL
jgi:hypothetical protein